MNQDEIYKGIVAHAEQTPIRKKPESVFTIQDINIENENPPELLKKAFDKLKKWINIGKFFEASDFNFKLSKTHHWLIELELATNNNIYHISVHYRKSNQKLSDLYMGCTMSSRRSRAGETWKRGNDLADGKFSEKLWNKILSDMLGAEMVKFQSDAWKNRERDQY